MKDGKAEIGTETRKHEGSKPPGVTADRFPMTHGTILPEGKWKEISAEFDAVGTTVNEKKNIWHKSARRVRREKPNSTQWTKVRPRIQNMKKDVDVGSESSLKFEKEKMKRTNQRVLLKRCNATLKLLRRKVMRQNKNLQNSVGTQRSF